MNKIDSVKLLVIKYIKELENDFLDSFIKNYSFGKMLRSKIILTIAPDSTHSIEICAIVELIHFASLLHDDVLDNASMRRGIPSINAKYGNKNAIMIGDILYSKAFYEISKIDSALSQIISNAVLKLSLGELEDMHLSREFNCDEQKYLRMIDYKTASIIEASAQIAGILANENSEKYKIYGNSLGIAFQIIDDLLDITGDEKKLGKPAFSDLKEGKSTLPYIYLYHGLSKNDKITLLSLFKKDLSEENKAWILNMMDKLNIINKTKEIALLYGNKALQNLDSNDDKLINIVKDMIFREF